MKFQFARLYLLILLVASLVIFSFSEIYENFIQNDSNYQISIEQIFPTLDEATVELSVIDRKSIVFPVALNLLLERHKVIKLADDSGYEYYYKLKNESQLLQYGPVLTRPIGNGDSEFYLVLIFYSVLALLVLSFIWPLFKDLAKLQAKALAFGENLSLNANQVKPSSSIYPLANTFDKMSHQIVETIQMHQDLSRTIAHEIRTPLARMKFVSALVSAHIDDEFEQRLKADIAEIEQLMEEYLSFERFEHEHYSLEKKLVDIDLFKATFLAKNQHHTQNIKLTFTANCSAAYFHEKSMNRALQNLVNNAFRYARSIVTVNFSVDEGQCTITVSDDGAGVGKEAQKLIQPFVRKESVEDKNSGYGLGLYIVRKIMIWHQGMLALKNCSELKGAKVTLTWPNNA